MRKPTPRPRLYTALGLMSGTSLDGIDVAWVKTDGRQHVQTGPAQTFTYHPPMVARLRQALGQVDPNMPSLQKLATDLTDLHTTAVQKFCRAQKIKLSTVDVVGFHGQTIFHAPEQRVTLQIGDGQRLADALGRPVVAQMRLADVAAGGNGAPLVPIFHASLSAQLPHPLMVLNIGGVSNMTWLPNQHEMLACDVGTGNALINDWLHRHGAGHYDEGGRLAASGQIDWGWVRRFIADPFFALPAPKSLDRDQFAAYVPNHLNLADGAATLTMMSVLGVARALEQLQTKPKLILVAGGGRHNQTLMRWLQALVPCAVQPVEAVGWQGDALEAQAFGYLAVRSLLGLPLTYPSTTGCKQPTSGGIYFQPERDRG